MKKIFFFFIISATISCSYAENSMNYIKEKQEITNLKKELNSFYTKKEKVYKEQKAELETLLAKVKSEKKQIKDLYEQNQKTLDNIQGLIQDKTTKIYNGMKPKVASKIFDTMINEGKIDDVFDIILKLKEKKVTLIMKFLSVENASLLTLMFENYKVNKGEFK